MSMREYEEVKNIVIPKEQEEMMDIICDAWEECRASESCKDCTDRPQTYMRIMMCTALKYTRKLIEAGYAKRQAADVAPVRHGLWLNLYGDFSTAECELCGELYEVSPDESPKKEYFDAFNEFYRFCPNCGALMDKEAE